MDGINVDYKERHEFPSGLTIDYESSPEEEYTLDLNQVDSQESFNLFVEKWRYLCPEIVHPSLSFDVLKMLRGNLELQDEYAGKAKDDPICAVYLHLLLPYTILYCSMRARMFGVSTGIVILQLWNRECFIQSEDGTWTLPLKPLSSTEVVIE